jgi:hypothetical protein
MSPAIWEAEVRRIKVKGRPGKKLAKPHLSQQARCGGGACL